MQYTEINNIQTHKTDINHTVGLEAILCHGGTCNRWVFRHFKHAFFLTWKARLVLCPHLVVPDFLHTSSQRTDALYSSHYNDVIRRTLAFQLTGVCICGSTVFRCRSKKTSKLRVTGLCAGNSRVTSVFPALKASNAENISIWWRHHHGRGALWQ